jgi:hypothetical protein
MAKTYSRYLRLSAVFAAAVMAFASPALAQEGPGANNPGPNVGNFGTCLITHALVVGIISPSDFATSEDPGVFIERGEDDFFEPHPGFACSVAFFGPPPGVGQP